MTVEILDPRHDPEPRDWPDFLRHQRLHPPWDYRLLAIEGTRLAVARHDGVPVAAFAFTVSHRKGLRWLEVHNPWLVGLPGWILAGELDPIQTKGIVRQFERAACHYAGIRGLGLVYRFVPPERDWPVAGRGRIGHAALGIAVLHNAFGSLEDWFRALDKKRRYRIRGQQRRIAADPDLTVTFAPARDDLTGTELAALLRRHRAKFGPQPFDSRGEISAEYLHALVRHPDVHTLTYRDTGGTLLAFATLLDHPEQPVYQHWAALSAQDGGRQHLYFDSYPRLIRHLVDRGGESLSAGRAMLDIKQSLGFTVQPRRVLAVPRPLAGRGAR
jgi:hypothetical protein